MDESKMQNRFENIKSLIINSKGVHCKIINGGNFYNAKESIIYSGNESRKVLPIEYFNIINEVSEPCIDSIKLITLYEQYNDILKKFSKLTEYEIFIKSDVGNKIFQDDKKSIKETVESYAVNFRLKLLENGCTFERGFGGTSDYKMIQNTENKLYELAKVTIDSKKSESIFPGFYTVVLDSEATGLFVHEVIGHNLEADNWIANKKIQEAFELGSKVASEEVTIVDNPLLSNASGSYLHDEEGTEAKETILIKGGFVNSLMHSKKTAYMMETKLTGNARAISYKFFPIVRMSNTYMLAGVKSIEEIIENIKYGIYMKGSRNSIGGENFCLSSREAYLIENGKITKNLKSVEIIGNSAQILRKIVDVSNDFNIYGGGDGGCGKQGQWPLPVGSGGPQVKISSVFVRPHKEKINNIKIKGESL